MSDSRKTVPATNAVRFITGALIVASSLFVLLFVTIAALRLAYPFEVEWMEGAVLDHAVRVFEGLPIYTAPTLDFAAWLYPPGYYYATACVMWFAGEGFLAGRIVSVFSTLLIAWITYRFVRKAGGAGLDGWLAASLWLASSAATGYYFDIVRVDAFFSALIMVGTLVAANAKSWSGRSLTAIIFTLAFFTKQQALFFSVAIAIWFFWQSRRVGLEFLFVSIFLLVAGYGIAQIATHGWFSYFVFAIPEAKRSDFSALRALDVLPKYVFGPWGIGSTIIAAGWLALRSDRDSKELRIESLLTLLLCAAFVTGALSIGNDGGYKNVMMPYAALFAPLVVMMLNRVVTRWPGIHTATRLILLLQFLALIYDPSHEKMVLASAHQRQGAEEFAARLRDIPGEVFIPYHGYIGRQAGKATHAHILASIDVLRMHDSTALRFQREFDSAYANHRFSAVIMEESSQFHLDSVSGYSLTGRTHREPNTGLTRVADDATRPEFVFTPRR